MVGVVVLLGLMLLWLRLLWLITVHLLLDVVMVGVASVVCMALSSLKNLECP